MRADKLLEDGNALNEASPEEYVEKWMRSTNIAAFKQSGHTLSSLCEELVDLFKECEKKKTSDCVVNLSKLLHEINWRAEVLHNGAKSDEKALESILKIWKEGQ